MGWGEDLSLNAQQAHERPGMATGTFSPTAGEADTGGFPGVVDLVTN